MRSDRSHPRVVLITVKILITSVRTYFSLSSVSPSRSVEERANTRDRSALAVEINAVIYYGKVETYAERACARAWVCVREGEGDGERRSYRSVRVIESNTRHAEKREGASLLVCAALLPGWEVFSIERTRSVRHSRLVANPAFSLWPTARLSVKKQEETHMKDTWRRCVTGLRVR